MGRKFERHRCWLSFFSLGCEAKRSPSSTLSTSPFPWVATPPPSALWCDRWAGEGRGGETRVTSDQWNGSEEKQSSFYLALGCVAHSFTHMAGLNFGFRRPTPRLIMEGAALAMVLQGCARGVYGREGAIAGRGGLSGTLALVCWLTCGCVWIARKRLALCMHIFRKRMESFLRGAETTFLSLSRPALPRK